MPKDYSRKDSPWICRTDWNMDEEYQNIMTKNEEIKHELSLYIDFNRVGPDEKTLYKTNWLKKIINIFKKVKKICHG